MVVHLKAQTLRNQLNMYKILQDAASMCAVWAHKKTQNPVKMGPSSEHAQLVRTYYVGALNTAQRPSTHRVHHVAHDAQVHPSTPNESAGSGQTHQIVVHSRVCTHWALRISASSGMQMIERQMQQSAGRFLNCYRLANGTSWLEQSALASLA